MGEAQVHFTFLLWNLKKSAPPQLVLFLPHTLQTPFFCFVLTDALVDLLAFLPLPCIDSDSNKSSSCNLSKVC